MYLRARKTKVLNRIAKICYGNLLPKEKNLKVKGSSWPWSYGRWTTYAISAYRHWCCEFESRSGRGAQHYVIRVCHWFATCRWFSPGPPVSSINQTDRRDITEILLKVVLYTIKKQNKVVLLQNHQQTYKEQSTEHFKDSVLISYIFFVSGLFLD